MTNLEWIRTLSLKELSDLLYDYWLPRGQYAWTDSRKGLMKVLSENHIERDCAKCKRHNNCYCVKGYGCPYEPRAEQTEQNSSGKPNNCDEPQYEMGMGTLKCDNCSEYGSFKCAKCDGEMYFKRLEPKDEPQNKMPCYGCEFSKPKYMEYECLRDSCKYEDEPQIERSE